MFIKQVLKFILNAKNVTFKKKKSKFRININKINFDFVINCAGMSAISIAKKTFPNNHFPKDNFVKGVYFKKKQIKLLLSGDIISGKKKTAKCKSFFELFPYHKLRNPTSFLFVTITDFAF